MRKSEVRKMSAGKWCVTVAVLAALCGCLTPLKRDMFGVRLGGKLPVPIMDELKASRKLGVRLVELDAEAPEVEKGKVRSIAVLGKKDVVLAVGYVVEMESVYDVEMARLRYEQEHGSCSEIGSIDGKFEYITTIRGDIGEAFVTEKSAYGIIRFDRKAVENVLRQVSVEDYRSDSEAFDALARMVGSSEIAEELAKRQNIETRESDDGSVRLERNLDTGTNVLTIGSRRIELVGSEQPWDGIDLTATGSDTGLYFRVNRKHELCQCVIRDGRWLPVGEARRLQGGESDDDDDDGEKPVVAAKRRPFRNDGLREVAPGVARYYGEASPDNPEGKPVKDVNAIRLLVIDSSVVSIPSERFAGWKKLETVSFADRRYSSGPALGARIFAGCPRLNCIVTLTSNEPLVTRADTFGGCPDDVVMVCKCDDEPLEARPVMGFPREIHMNRLDERMTRHGDFCFREIGGGQELLYYTGKDETVHVPSEVNGLPVDIIQPSAFMPPSPVKTVFLPHGCDRWIDPYDHWNCEPPHLEKVLMDGPYSSEIRRWAKIDTVYARSVADRDRSEEKPVVVVPECAPFEEYLADTNRLAKSGPISYYRHPDCIEVLAYDRGPDGLVDVPDEIEGLPVTKIATGFLAGVDPRNVRLPDAVGDWSLSPELVGRWEKDLAGYLAATNKADAVRRFAEPREVPSFGRVERLPNYSDIGEGDSVKWTSSDSCGRYAETLARMERGIAEGDVQAKAGLANYLMYGRPGLYGIVNRARARALCEEVVGSVDPMKATRYEGYALLDALTMLEELDGGIAPELEQLRGRCVQRISSVNYLNGADFNFFFARKPFPPLLFMKDPYNANRHLWWTMAPTEENAGDLAYLIRVAAVRGDRAARTLIDEDGRVHLDRLNGCWSFAAPKGADAVWPGFDLDAPLGYRLGEAYDLKGRSDETWSVAAPLHDISTRQCAAVVTVSRRRWREAEMAGLYDALWMLRGLVTERLATNPVYSGSGAAWNNPIDAENTTRWEKNGRRYGLSIMRFQDAFGIAYEVADDVLEARRKEEYGKNLPDMISFRIPSVQPVITNVVAEGELKAETDRLGLSVLSSADDDFVLRSLLYLPDGASNSIPLVIYIPGKKSWGDPIRQFRYRALIDKVLSPDFQSRHPSGLLVLSPPETLGSLRTGATRPRRTHLLIMATLDELLSRYPQIDRSRIYATGLSHGGGGAFALAYHYPDTFAAAVSVYSTPSKDCLPYTRFPGNWRFYRDAADEARENPEDDGYVCFRDKVNAAGGDCRIIGIPAGADVRSVVWQDDETWDWLFSKHR